MIALVIWVLRMKEETTTDYFLAGRDAGWLAIGASIFASNIGSEHVVGLAGAGASTGMAMAHWEMHAWLILVLGWVFVPFYSRSMVYTMPEFLERRFSPGARSFLSIISLVSYVLTKVAVTVYAGGIVFKQGARHRELDGHRFLLDRRYRLGDCDGHLHRHWRDEVGALYIAAANPHSTDRVGHDSGDRPL